MSYIWKHYTSEKKYSRQYKITPYFETFGDSKENSSCWINPLLRFSNFNLHFNALDEKNISLYEKNFSEITDSSSLENVFSQYLGLDSFSDIDFTAVENIIFHMLALKDIEFGLDEKQMKMNFLEKEINSGYFGNSIKEKWNNLVPKDKNFILFFLSNENTFNIKHFSDLLIKLFAEISIVWEKNIDKYYLYIGDKKTKYRTELFEIIKYFFWPSNLNLDIVWFNHYGVLGIDKTMQIDCISILD